MSALLVFVVSCVATLRSIDLGAFQTSLDRKQTLVKSLAPHVVSIFPANSIVFSSQIWVRTGSTKADADRYGCFHGLAVTSCVQNTNRAEKAPGLDSIGAASAHLVPAKGRFDDVDGYGVEDEFLCLSV